MICRTKWETCGERRGECGLRRVALGWQWRLAADDNVECHVKRARFSLLEVENDDRAVIDSGARAEVTEAELCTAAGPNDGGVCRPSAVLDVQRAVAHDGESRLLSAHVRELRAELLAPECERGWDEEALAGLPAAHAGIPHSPDDNVVCYSSKFYYIIN